MLLSFLYGLIGIIILTSFCVIGAFITPPMAYWFMTPKAKRKCQCQPEIHTKTSCLFDCFDRHSLHFILMADYLCRKTGCWIRDESVTAQHTISDYILDDIHF